MPAAIAVTAAAAPKPQHAMTAALTAASKIAAADATFVLPDAAAAMPAALPAAAASAAAPAATATAKTPASKAADSTKAAPDSAPGEGTLAWLLSTLSGVLAPSAAPPVGDQLPGGVSAQTGVDAAAHEQGGAAARAGTGTTAPAANPRAAAAQPTPADPAAQTDQASTQLPQAGTAAGASAVAPAAAAAPATVKAAEAPAVQIAATATAADSFASAPAQNVPTNTFAAALAHGADASAAPVSPTPAAAHSTLDLSQANWPSALAEHVHWQILDGVQEARLELNPRELGNVQVHVRLSGSETQVQFAAVHPQMREVLSAGLPQLRALLADGGLQLSQAQVGGQGQSPRQASTPWTGGSAGEASAQDEEVPTLTRIGSVRVGLVDDFA